MRPSPAAIDAILAIGPLIVQARRALDVASGRNSAVIAEAGLGDEWGHVDWMIRNVWDQLERARHLVTEAGCDLGGFDDIVMDRVVCDEWSTEAKLRRQSLDEAETAQDELMCAFPEMDWSGVSPT